MTWQVKITRADNGYVMEWEEESESEEGKLIKHQLVISEEDGEDNELKSMKQLLIEIKGFFGVNYSKHNKKNLVINIEEKDNIL